MHLTTLRFYPILVTTVVFIHTSNGHSVPAGLRPAKKFGDPKDQNVLAKQQQQQQEEQGQQHVIFY